MVLLEFDKMSECNPVLRKFSSRRFFRLNWTEGPAIKPTQSSHIHEYIQHHSIIRSERRFRRFHLILKSLHCILLKAVSFVAFQTLKNGFLGILWYTCALLGTQSWHMRLLSSRCSTTPMNALPTIRWRKSSLRSPHSSWIFLSEAKRLVHGQFA